MKSNKQNGKDKFKEFQKKNSLEWWFETLQKIITTKDMRKKKKTKRHTYHADLAEPRQETSVILRKTGHDGSISKSFPTQKDIRYL